MRDAARAEEEFDGDTQASGADAEGSGSCSSLSPVTSPISSSSTENKMPRS